MCREAIAHTFQLPIGPGDANPKRQIQKESSQLKTPRDDRSRSRKKEGREAAPGVEENHAYLMSKDWKVTSLRGTHIWQVPLISIRPAAMFLNKIPFLDSSWEETLRNADKDH